MTVNTTITTTASLTLLWKFQGDHPTGRLGDSKLPLSLGVFLKMAGWHEVGDEKTGVYSDIMSE